MIESGEKDIEWRDAHITFICEETGRTLKKYVRHAKVIEKKGYDEWEKAMFSNKEEWARTLSDDYVIAFVLEDKPN